MIDVNLLPEQKASSVKRNKITKYCVVATVIFTVVLGGAAFGLFYYNQHLLDQLNLLSTQKTDLQSRLSQQKETVYSLLLLKEKVNGIDYLQSSRFNFPDSLKYIFNLLPPDITISRISENEKGAVVMELKSSDATVVSDFVAKMGKDPVLKGIQMTDFRYGDPGTYMFSVSAQYGNNVEK